MTFVLSDIMYDSQHPACDVPFAGTNQGLCVPVLLPSDMPAHGVQIAL
jgi:hypothetical protein